MKKNENLIPVLLLTLIIVSVVQVSPQIDKEWV